MTDAPADTKALHEAALASKRYRVVVSKSQYGGEPYAGFTPDINGAWVRFSDYQPLADLAAALSDYEEAGK
jgi:hypothetical protein